MEDEARRNPPDLIDTINDLKTALGAKPPSVSVSISRKVNLGNYESVDLFMSVNGVDKYTTQEEIDEALAAGELAYGQLKEHLRARIVEVMRTRTGQ